MSAAPSQISTLQHKAARLREALASCGAFFAASHRADPLPTLRDLAADWLRAEELDIVVPSGTAALAPDDPTRLCSSIMIGRRVVGRIDARRSRPFEEDDRAMGAALGQIIGAVLEHSSLQSQLDQYFNQNQANADTLDQLLTFGRLVVSATADPQQLALQLATQVPQMVGGERASLLLTPTDSPDSPTLVLSNGTVLSTERARELRDSGLAGLVLSQRAPMIIDETHTDRRWRSLTAQENDAPTRCAMAVPLIWGEHTLGALTVTTTRTHLFDTAQLNLLELVACHISLAIHAATLEERVSRAAATLGAAAAKIAEAVAAARAGDDTALDRIAAIGVWMTDLVEGRAPIGSSPFV
jgi:hypothetical protein